MATVAAEPVRDDSRLAPIGDIVEALLSSPQFLAMHPTAFVGSSVEVMAVFEAFELALVSMDRAPTEKLAGIAAISDGLFVSLPVMLVQQWVNGMVRRDPDVLEEMPQMQQVLANIRQAIELSKILNPAFLSRIAADLKSSYA